MGSRPATMQPPPPRRSSPTGEQHENRPACAGFGAPARMPQRRYAWSTSRATDEGMPDSTSRPAGPTRRTSAGAISMSGAATRLAMTIGHTPSTDSGPPLTRRSRPSSPFSRAFSSAACSASGSMSRPTASGTPRSSAASASTPDPVPSVQQSRRNAGLERFFQGVEAQRRRGVQPRPERRSVVEPERVSRCGQVRRDDQHPTGSYGLGLRTHVDPSSRPSAGDTVIAVGPIAPVRSAAGTLSGRSAASPLGRSSTSSAPSATEPIERPQVGWTDRRDKAPRSVARPCACRNSPSGVSTLKHHRLPRQATVGHVAAGASRLAALLIAHLCPTSSLFAPCDPGAAPGTRYRFSVDTPLAPEGVTVMHASAPSWRAIYASLSGFLTTRMPVMISPSTARTNTDSTRPFKPLRHHRRPPH